LPTPIGTARPRLGSAHFGRPKGVMSCRPEDASFAAQITEVTPHLSTSRQAGHGTDAIIWMTPFDPARGELPFGGPGKPDRFVREGCRTCAVSAQTKTSEYSTTLCSYGGAEVPRCTEAKRSVCAVKPRRAKPAKAPSGSDHPGREHPCDRPSDT
jgi:hypothetical protein